MTAAPAAGTWSEELWAAMKPVYDRILLHPFLVELRTGRLDEPAFTRFLVQDSHYLRDYARALAVLAARAPSHLDTATLAAHAAGAVAAELDLHQRLLGLLGTAAGPVRAPNPTTIAYTSYLLATVHVGSFAEGLAAVLPCYWIYARVAQDLAERSSPHRVYRAWIDSYAASGFAEVVKAVLQLVDAEGERLTEAHRGRARAHLLTTARYEWMFWDAAYRDEQWPI
jgi:thiaminase/transcriptional activator TenA